MYSLPALREDDLRWARTHRARLEVPGLGRTWFRVVGAELEETNHYVAVLLPEEALLPLICLPDGRNGSALDSGVSIDGGCLRLEPGDSAEQAWRDVLIRVRVHSPGYEQVDLEFRAGDGPPLILLVAEGER